MPDGTILQNRGVGVWRGGVWLEIEGPLPPAPDKALPLTTPKLDPSPTFDIRF